MDWLRRDIKVGVRSLIKDPSFLATAVLALALGIGSVTAIFSVIDNVLLEPFPYTDAKNLVVINIHDTTSNREGGRSGFSQPEFLDYQRQNAVFTDSVGAAQDRVLWTPATGTPESFIGTTVTGNTFTFMGVAPLIGRYLTPADANPSAPPVFVMSYKVWQGRFAGDHSILGKSFTFDGTPRTLVGVMPKRFAWMGSDIWTPGKPNVAETNDFAPFYFFLGHLKPGLTIKSAQPNLTLVAQRLSKVYPKQYPKKFDVRLQTLADMVVGDFSNTLYTLLAAVGLLLLIACANVANLMLARATTREKEFAVRSSLGSGRWRIIRQLMTESLLLGLLSAAVGCLFAFGGLQVLVAVMPKFTFPDEAAIGLNARVLAATAAVAIFTPLLFGLVPALGTFSSDLSAPLKAGGRGNSGFRRGRLRNALVALEVALSVVLLVGAGLMMRSFLAQQHADFGFVTDNLMVSDIGLNKSYTKTADQVRFAHELSTRLSSTPGVRAVSASVDFAPFGGMDTDLDIAGKAHHENWKGQMGFVDAQYFPVLKARLLRGRLLTQQDIEGKRHVVVINQAFAKKYFPTENPLGRQVKLIRMEQLPEPPPNAWFEVIGVSGNIRNHGVRDDIVPEAYAPVTLAGVGEYFLYVRAIGNPLDLAKMIDGQVLSIDRTVHPNETQSMASALDQFQYAKPRFAMEIFSVFAGVGLLLVTLGVYSVVSYTVAQQTKEIGIRMALGAHPGDVIRLVVVSGMRFIVIGLLVGTGVGFFVMRYMKSQIAGISVNDPITLSSVLTLLLLIGLGACYLPSLRATRVDPLVSLRYE